MSSKPFVYILKHVNSGRHYIGVRYAKGCSVDDLMTEEGYKTSSKLVHEMIKKDGLDSFLIKRIRVFDSKESAVNYEYKLLQRVKARTNKKIININDKRAFALNEEAYELMGLTALRKNLVLKFGTYDFAEIRKQLLPLIDSFYTIKMIRNATKYGNRSVLNTILPELVDKEYLKKAKSLAIDNPETKRKLSEAGKRGVQTDEQHRKQRETRKKKGTRNKNLGVRVNTAAARDIASGESLGMVSCDDPRWVTGCIISSCKGVSKNTKNKQRMVDKSGNIIYVEKNSHQPDLVKWEPSQEYLEKLQHSQKLGAEKSSLCEWFTDGTNSIFINAELEDIPLGYIKGRTISEDTKQKHRENGRKNKWYTDGVTSIFTSDDPPAGYRRGRHARSLTSQR